METAVKAVYVGIAEEADTFLKKHGVELQVKYLKNDFYFEGDKEKRDIYNITLTRKSRCWNFNFGQSLNDSGFVFLPAPQYRYFGIADNSKEDFKIAKSYFSKTLKQSIKDKDIQCPVFPSAYEVLTAITKNDPGTFKDFCGDFGYDTDSRLAEKQYKLVCEEWKNVQRMFTDDEIEKLREIR